MVDPGTILAVVQLSASVLKLGRDIAFEFFGPAGAHEKLGHLNSRLQILNDYLEEILEKPGSPDKLFPGSASLEKTLKECKAFLEHYRSLLSKPESFNAAAQRLLLVTGPNALRIDEFHRRIDQHYIELGHWRMGNVSDIVHEIHKLVTSALPDPTATYPPPYPNDSTPERRSRPGSYSIGAASTTPSPNQQLLSPTILTSPVLRAQSRNPSLNSIPELPPTIIPSPLLSTAEARPYVGSDGSPICHNNLEPAPSSTAPLIVPSSRHPITLLIGVRRKRFSLDTYQVYEDGAARIIECVGSQIRVRHYLPLIEDKRIPYTKPEDPRVEVTFLPRHSKHRCEIITPEGPKNGTEEFSYQFPSKADRERFQKRVRMKNYLQMVRAVRIHTLGERNIALDVHLKVWAQDENDSTPTMSFAWLGEDNLNHHVEYTIRWFKKEPERKGNKPPRLIMRPYIEQTDLSYRPVSDNSTRKNSTFKDLTRRMSSGSSMSSASRSPSLSNPSGILYEPKGMTAPDHVRELGYLEIEFESVGIRESFVNACFQAHHPSPGTPRRATLALDMDSFGANQASAFSSRSQTVSQTTTPQHSVTELDATVCPVELPSPAIPRHTPLQFNNPNPFEMPDTAIPIRQELEVSELSPTDVQDEGAPQ